MSTTPDSTAARLEALLTAYGQAAFDCGEMSEEAEGYAPIRARFDRTRKELADFVTAALEGAADIIEKVGTTGIEHQHQQAQDWLSRYYPARL